MKLFTIANITLLLSFSVPVISSPIQKRNKHTLEVPHEMSSFNVYCRGGAKYDGEDLRVLAGVGAMLLKSNHSRVIPISKFSYTVAGPYFAKSINDVDYVVFTEMGIFVGVVSVGNPDLGEKMEPCLNM
ncbi:BgTH12-04974 [Blumeria graminis f. sp. triticale]|uniref:BgtE-20057 n=3 Tax=Blumeria graminis TaxID=34373 RepID=A0A381LK31_BLUGR|nr:BgTH12-04974 [Blumeria graminis f. sp. triticale]VDB87652.1 BgtE-20057 [Blumeria graminis f. sp. tritici]